MLKVDKQPLSRCRLENNVELSMRGDLIKPLQ